MVRPDGRDGFASISAARRRRPLPVIGLFALGAGAVVAAAGVVAVTSRDPRAATVGLLAVLLGAVFVADPWPPPAALAVRVVAGILAGYVLWVVVRNASEPTAGSALAWPSEALLGLAGAVVGWASHGLGAPGRGPEAASAVGIALLVLAASPIALGGRDAFRVGVGLTLLLTGAELLRVGLAGTPGPAEQIVLAALTAGLGGAVAVLVRGAKALRAGDGSSRAVGDPAPAADGPGSPPEPAAP